MAINVSNTGRNTMATLDHFTSRHLHQIISRGNCRFFMPNSQTSWYHFKTASSAPSASRAICLLPGLLILPGFMQSQDSSSPKLANERDAPKKCELLELPFHVTFHLKSLRFIKKIRIPRFLFPSLST